MQLDYWNPASAESLGAKGEAPRLDTAERVSTKIEQIGQRMRNVEEVFSALKENLDQVLGNLQDGILLFTGTAGQCWFLKPRSAFLMWRAITSSEYKPARSSTVPRFWEEPFATPSMPASPWCRKKYSQRPGAASRHRLISSTTTTPGWALERWSPCTIRNRSNRSNRNWSFPAAWLPSDG